MSLFLNISLILSTDLRESGKDRDLPYIPHMKYKILFIVFETPCKTRSISIKEITSLFLNIGLILSLDLREGGKDRDLLYILFTVLRHPVRLDPFPSQKLCHSF